MYKSGVWGNYTHKRIIKPIKDTNRRRKSHATSGTANPGSSQFIDLYPLDSIYREIDVFFEPYRQIAAAGFTRRI